MLLGELKKGDKFRFTFDDKSIVRTVVGYDEDYDFELVEVQDAGNNSSAGWHPEREVIKLDDVPLNTGKGDPRFHQRLKELGELHDKKQADYGVTGDPFANVRASEEMGIDPWVGAILRLNDKVQRIKSFIKNGKLENESLRDSFKDISVYALIADILYCEQYGEK